MLRGGGGRGLAAEGVLEVAVQRELQEKGYSGIIINIIRKQEARLFLTEQI